MCGPHHCLGRGASTPNSEILRSLLQWRQNASLSKQRCAGFSAGSAIRFHKFVRHLGWTSPSLRADLIFRYTQVSRRMPAGFRSLGFQRWRERSPLHDCPRPAARWSGLSARPLRDRVPPCCRKPRRGSATVNPWPRIDRSSRSPRSPCAKTATWRPRAAVSPGQVEPDRILGTPFDGSWLSKT